MITLFILCALSGQLDTSRVPGVVVDHSAASTRQYIGSPSLAILADGTYVASHDFFGPGSSKDTTAVFQSKDRGKTWAPLAQIKGQWWSTLFVHEGALYLMGTSKEYGFCVIRRSTDGGRTWTEPKDSESGLLHGDGKYHCAPVPILIHKGRIWRAMEDAQGPGGWGSHFRAFMMSAPVDANLLDARSWTSSNRIGRDPNWLNGQFGGWLEGNAVATPDGGVIDLLRVDLKAKPEHAAVIKISPDGKTASFDPKTGFIPFPGGGKKFTVRYDPTSKKYWTLTNWIPDEIKPPHAPAVRNTLALASSTDLEHWQVVRTLLSHPDRLRHAFQYVDWLFEGSDIVFLSRTAFDDGLGGAHNAHDANFLTFHRIADFRGL